MAKHRLLLVEDDYDVAEMLLMYFESLKYEVIHADTGEAGIEIARTKFPNLILLDIMLPDMDGYDVCRKLRSMSLTKFIPTLFLTQRDELSSKVRGLELGADDYITKPFDIDELRLRVEGAIRRATRENLHEARTGLPTGPLIEEERQKRRNQEHREIYFAIEGFQTYTDVYSFMAATDVLYHAGKVIRDVLSELGQHDDFIGSVNEEFVVMTTLENLDDLVNAAQERFSEQVRAFYSFADADRGGILLNPGEANERFVPMMQLVPAAVAQSGAGSGEDAASTSW
jgi:DNA-binding response OmpR family regulator